MSAGTYLPSGTFTFLFTDVEGSTKLLHALGADAYADAMATHCRLLRAAFTADGGVEVDTQGDAFFVAFPTAPGALAAARQRPRPWPPARSASASARTPAPSSSPPRATSAPTSTRARASPGPATAARSWSAPPPPPCSTPARTCATSGCTGSRTSPAPERIMQFGHEDHTPLKTLHQTNLPVPVSSFVGRGAEIKQLLEEIPGARLVTLTGAGGTGKTRLAIEVASRLVPAFPEGVFWVPLAPLADVGAALSRVRRVVGASGALPEFLAGRQMLLVLDNVEQIPGFGPPIGSVLADCPDLVLLVTSRQRLRVTGEREFRVAPLDKEDAVALVGARAGTGDEEGIRLLCERLDYLPLAIELAAA